MTVQFNTIPSNTLVPLFYAEFNSGGSPFQTQPRLLLIGPKTSGGAATAGVPYGPVQSKADVIAQAGIGSVLVQMVRIARRNAPFQPIWILPLADPSGAAAAGTITFVAPGVTGAGIVRLMGRAISVQVNAADTRATVCANVVAAINAAKLPVTAAVDGTNNYQANLTFNHVGTIGNGIDVSLPAANNVFTATNAAIVAMSGGTGVPALTTPLANLGSDEYDWIASPYSDTTSLNAIRDFLSDSAGRWSPSQQLYGHHITYASGSLSTLATLGAGRNDQHTTIMGVQANPTPVWERAAALGALASLHLANPPECSRPLQTLVLNGVLPPDDRSTWWSISDRQALYVAGIGAEHVNADGSVAVDRSVTTYKTNAAGAADATFRDMETMAQGMYAIRYLRNVVLTKYARVALADDDPFNVGLATPRKIKADMIHAYNDLVALGLAEKPDVFAQFLVVERNQLDANRVDVFFPIDVVNQLRVFAANVTAFLQFTSPSGAVAI
jgi:phage tail sheath gpL-like